MIKKFISILFVLVLLTQILPVKLIVGCVVYGQDFSIENDLSATKKANQQTLEEEIKPHTILCKYSDSQFDYFQFAITEHKYFQYSTTIYPPPHLDKDCPPPNCI